MNKTFKLERYVAFSGDTYYPRGGWNDFNCTFDTVEKCLAHMLDNSDLKSIDWYHILDTETGQLVREKY